MIMEVEPHYSGEAKAYADLPNADVQAWTGSWIQCSKHCRGIKALSAGKGSREVHLYSHCAGPRAGDS
jgi:hypothetical protein